MVCAYPTEPNVDILRRSRTKGSSSVATRPGDRARVTIDTFVEFLTTTCHPVQYVYGTCTIRVKCVYSTYQGYSTFAVRLQLAWVPSIVGFGQRVTFSLRGRFSAADETAETDRRIKPMDETV